MEEEQIVAETAAEEVGSEASATNAPAEELSPRDRALEALSGLADYPTEAAEEPQEAAAEEEVPEPVEAPEEPETPSVRVSEAFAKISRAEAQARRRIQEAEQRLHQQKAELEPLQGLKDRISELENPLEVLEALGQAVGVDLSYDTLTDAVVSGKLPSKQSAKNADLPPEVQERIQRLEQQLQTQAEQHLDRQVASYHADVERTLNTSPEDYEFIVAEAQDQGITPQQFVSQFVAEVYEGSSKRGEPQLLLPQEACQSLENYLAQRAERYLQLNKIRSKLAPTGDTTAQDVSAKPQIKPTLTSRLSASTQRTDTDDSEEARRRRAEQAVERLFASGG